MSLHRFFLSESAGAAFDTGAQDPVPLPLGAEDRHHITHVLRLAAGDEVIVVDDRRRAFVVALVEAGRAADAPITARVIRELEAADEPHVTLVQGLAKGDRLDLVVEKAVELGVEAVVPVAFERSVVRLDPERAHARGERLRRVAAAAAKQSQRSFVPRVSDPVQPASLAGILEGFDLVLIAWEDADQAPGIGEALRVAGADAGTRVAMVVGPEGGLTALEVGSLLDSGAVVVSLGETILRTETAGILSAALCVYEMGGLGGRSRG